MIKVYQMFRFYFRFFLARSFISFEALPRFEKKGFPLPPCLFPRILSFVTGVFRFLFFMFGVVFFNFFFFWGLLIELSHIAFVGQFFSLHHFVLFCKLENFCFLSN